MGIYERRGEPWCEKALAEQRQIGYFFCMSAFKNKKAGKPVEQMIVDTIVRHIKPKRIILFGSRARDDAQPRSDYDIAIDDDELTPAELARIRVGMEIVPTLLAIDVMWMNHAAETLRRRILSEGKTLYERQS